MVKIEVYQQDWIPGFAAFLDDGSIHKDGKAHVVLNIAATAAAVAVGDLDKKDVPYAIASDLLHEIVHVLEAWAGVEFNEDRVDSIVEKYREHYEKSNAAFTGAPFLRVRWKA